MDNGKELERKYIGWVQELVEGERMGNTARVSLVETRLSSDMSQEVSYRVAGPDSVMEGLRVLGRMQREAKNFALLNGRIGRARKMQGDEIIVEALCLTDTIGSGYKATKMASGDLLVEVKDKSLFQKLTKLVAFGDKPITVTAHRTMNTVKGVVSDDDLMDLTDSDLLAGWKDENVIQGAAPRRHQAAAQGTCSVRERPSLAPRAGAAKAALAPLNTAPLEASTCTGMSQCREQTVGASSTSATVAPKASSSETKPRRRTDRSLERLSDASSEAMDTTASQSLQPPTKQPPAAPTFKVPEVNFSQTSGTTPTNERDPVPLDKPPSASASPPEAMEVTPGSSASLTLTASPKVQLHSHLDTYIRHETIWQLSQQKELGLSYNTIENVRERTRPEKCTSLDSYLKEVPNFLRAILGDRDALERVAYEAGLDQACEGVIYSEMRIPPQLLAASTTVLPLDGSPASAVSARDVVDATLRGLRHAERETGVKIRLILTCLRGTPEWAPDVVELCREYIGQGVVGIDVCGVVALRSGSAVPSPSVQYGEEITDPLIIESFQRAASWGIHRTAHAGEAGPPATVLRAVHELHAERIGHGYRAILEGGCAYRQALSAGVHFECCLTSSILTGAVNPSTQEHPVLRLRRDGASFSISVDDPTITHTTLEDEYRLALTLGLDPADLLKCNRSAISACFLPPDEKWELQQKFNELLNVEM
ncbi:uncharacterized protein LOC119403587 [Rhipicephalus sanguineus]|uniref:uncharacterized protein LOC119403587 n=1 Tax=Rhipicephalus sanguineus TaxID=34632 RepID=UPI0020C453A1|nr:uncharacterized protein LOC119403587 [Rhipicephalus sanguineus]